MSSRSKSRLDTYQAECSKLLQANSYRHRLHQVFADFCELSALAISNAVDRAQYELREARYLDIVKGYEREEVARFPQMLACAVNSLEAGPSDFLGRLFMDLELGNHWKGQFFTPYEVSSLMARMLFGATTEAEIEAAGGFLTLNETAVGAGGMVIAAAQALREAQINYQRHLHVVAQDIDATAAHMAYVQLSLLHVPAIVIQGNSLALEQRAHWVTPAHVMGGWDIRLQARWAKSQSAAEQAEPTDEMRQAAANVVDRRIQDAEQLALF